MLTPFYNRLWVSMFFELVVYYPDNTSNSLRHTYLVNATPPSNCCLPQSALNLYVNDMQVGIGAPPPPPPPHDTTTSQTEPFCAGVFTYVYLTESLRTRLSLLHWNCDTVYNSWQYHKIHDSQWLSRPAYQSPNVLHKSVIEHKASLHYYVYGWWL